MIIKPIKQNLIHRTRFSGKPNDIKRDFSDIYKAWGYRVDEEGNIHIKNPIPQKKVNKSDNPIKKQDNLAEGTTKNELLKGVLGHSKETMYKILNEYYGVAKRRFPGQKVTVFFSAVQNKQANHTKYAMAVGVNSDAPEGISRSDEELPGFSLCQDADFYHTKVAYTHPKNKISYEMTWQDVMFDLKDAIEEHKRKGMKNEN